MFHAQADTRPDILDALKARLNREGSLPGTAVVTGSTRQDALPPTTQALTGRVHALTIWPLSQGEIAGSGRTCSRRCGPTPTVPPARSPTSATTRADYVDRVRSGGLPLPLPLPLRRSGAARARWFDDFVRASVERDALELSRIRDRQAMTDLLGLLAAQTGQLLNASAAADRLGVSRPMVESHMRLLEALFLVVLTGLDPAALADFGHLLETLVVGEIRKQASWLETPVALGHWRTMTAWRSAWSSTRGRHHPRHRHTLLHLRDPLHVTPIDRLWTPATVEIAHEPAALRTTARLSGCDVASGIRP